MKAPFTETATKDPLHPNMADETIESSKRVVSPIDRVSEVLFGLIMVLTFTGSLSVAEAGRDPEAPELPRLSKDDWVGSIGVFLIVFVSTFPVVLPFISRCSIGV
jgi:hypothetical protein